MQQFQCTELSKAAASQMNSGEIRVHVGAPFWKRMFFNSLTYTTKILFFFSFPWDFFSLLPFTLFLSYSGSSPPYTWNLSLLEPDLGQCNKLAMNVQLKQKTSGRAHSEAQTSTHEPSQHTLVIKVTSKQSRKQSNYIKSS